MPQMPPEGPFSVLKQDFPSGISILAALMIQGAIFGAVDGHDILAGLLYFAGTAAIAYRTLQMFQDLPALTTRNVRQRTWAVLILATFLIVFAWLPYIVRSRGTGAGGDSTAGGRARRSMQTAEANGVGGRQDHGTTAALARLRAFFVPDSSESHGNSF